jgi:hypothetical protein
VLLDNIKTKVVLLLAKIVPLDGLLTILHLRVVKYVRVILVRPLLVRELVISVMMLILSVVTEPVKHVSLEPKFTERVLYETVGIVKKVDSPLLETPVSIVKKVGRDKGMK